VFVRAVRAIDVAAAATLAAFMAAVSVVARVTQPEARPVSALGLALQLVCGSGHPRWAAGSMIASSPLTIAAFVLPGSPRIAGGIALGLLALGGLPAAWTTLRGRSTLGAEAAG
jgi:hypothetical protein